MKKISILSLVLFTAISMAQCAGTDTVKLKNGQTVQYHTEWGFKVFGVPIFSTLRKEVLNPKKNCSPI